MSPRTPNRSVFPKRKTVLQTVESSLYQMRAEDEERKLGVFHNYWPNGGAGVQAIAAEATKLFAHHLWLGRYSQAAVLRMASEVADMSMEILGAPPGAHCTLTSGGTESNFLACLAARERGREHRPHIALPEIVLPHSAHPSFDKAAHYLGMKTRRVPIRADFRADVGAMDAAISERTIMLVGSAPPYPHGQVDPIAEIGELALARGLWCHVDACVGGFLIPFLRKLGGEVPRADLALPGVRSLSADLHKYGYTAHGISTLTLREASEAKLHTFDFTDWPFGRMTVPTVSGTKGAGPIAAAWAVMTHLGEEGYLELARGLLRATGLMREGIAAIGGLELLAPPEAGVFTFTSPELDMEAIAEGMMAQGYESTLCKQPLGLHLLMEPVEDESFIGDYLDTLQGVVHEVRAGRIIATGNKADYI